MCRRSPTSSTNWRKPHEHHDARPDDAGLPRSSSRRPRSRSGTPSPSRSSPPSTSTARMSTRRSSGARRSAAGRPTASSSGRTAKSFESEPHTSTQLHVACAVRPRNRKRGAESRVTWEIEAQDGGVVEADGRARPARACAEDGRERRRRLDVHPQRHEDAARDRRAAAGLNVLTLASCASSPVSGRATRFSRRRVSTRGPPPTGSARTSSTSSRPGSRVRVCSTSTQARARWASRRCRAAQQPSSSSSRTPRPCRTIERNLDKLRLSGATIVRRDAVTGLAAGGRSGQEVRSRAWPIHRTR